MGILHHFTKHVFLCWPTSWSWCKVWDTWMWPLTCTSVWCRCGTSGWFGRGQGAQSTDDLRFGHGQDWMKAGGESRFLRVKHGSLRAMVAFPEAFPEDSETGNDESLERSWAPWRLATKQRSFQSEDESLRATLRLSELRRVGIARIFGVALDLSLSSVPYVATSRVSGPTRDAETWKLWLHCTQPHQRVVVSVVI